MTFRRVLIIAATAAVASLVATLILMAIGGQNAALVGGVAGAVGAGVAMMATQHRPTEKSA